jgi:probable phosphoglycerate mutase
MKLILVRHGQTGHNATKIVQGHSHNPLSTIGQEQAKLVGERLKNERFDIIYCSDLKRTKDTLLGIIKYHPHTEVIYEPLLRERSSGVFDGKPVSLREEARMMAGLSKEDFRPDGGENDDDFILRIRQFIKMLLENYQDETILAVSHWRWISKLLKDIDPSFKEKLVKDEDIANTSINIIELKRDGKHKVELVNSTDHLSEIPSNGLAY